jgi:cytochrome P450
VSKSVQRESALSGNTIVSILLRTTDPETGQRLSFKDLVANTSTLLSASHQISLIFRVAGADTTAVTLTFALYFIIADRKVWEILSREIRSKFKSKDDITGPSTASLPYLNGVINEGNKGHHMKFANRRALRIRPVAAAGQPRETPPEGTMIAGHYIVGNVPLCLNRPY